MKEIVVTSGKGGTGKTSVLAAFAALAEDAVLADCDVDAADLHLVLSPAVRRRERFRSGRVAIIRQEYCGRCGLCFERCRFGGVTVKAQPAGASGFVIDPHACEGCGVCVRLCPSGAIEFPERDCGEWYVSDTRFGPLVHARLYAAAENSGKLVSTVRREAKCIATDHRSKWVLVDGPPGIACPVIASVTGASMVLVVCEPTLSGLHDMERVLSLARHFGIPGLVCVNKWDLNPEVAAEIERGAIAAGFASVGRVRYDRSVTSAQIAGRTVVEYGGAACEDLRALWAQVRRRARDVRALA